MMVHSTSNEASIARSAVLGCDIWHADACSGNSISSTSQSHCITKRSKRPRHSGPMRSNMFGVGLRSSQQNAKRPRVARVASSVSVCVCGAMLFTLLA